MPTNAHLPLPPFELRTLRAVADHPNRTCLFLVFFFPTLKNLQWTCYKWNLWRKEIFSISTDSLVLFHQQYLETSVLTSYFSNDFYSYRCLWIESKQEEQEMRWCVRVQNCKTSVKKVFDTQPLKWIEKIWNPNSKNWSLSIFLGNF